MDILILQKPKYTTDVESVLYSESYGYWKNMNGEFLGCNEPLIELAGKGTTQEMLGLSDYEQPWGERADIYRTNDNWIKRNRHATWFLEPITTPQKKVVPLLTVKAPLISTDDTVIGVAGISINIDKFSFNDVLSEFMHAAKKLDLTLAPRDMVQLTAQIIQLNDCQQKWEYDRQLFDYGKVKFTLREAQCLHYLLRGYSADKTAKKLYISPKTVEHHIANIKVKLDSKDRITLMNKAIDIGFVDLMFMAF